MLFASYIATKSGWSGIINRLIRWRFGGSFTRDGQSSHCEVVFEPGDGVDALMPDGSCAADADGALWCATSDPTDIVPMWAPTRQGKMGGVRFKRIVLDPSKWDLQPYPRDAQQVAKWFRVTEGKAYDWGLVLGYIFWSFVFFINKNTRWCCSSAAAAAGGFERPDFYHPELLRTLIRNENQNEKQ